MSFTLLSLALLLMVLLSTIVHEFLHAFVAYLGGDRSERNRQQLYDPTTYVDPIFTLAVPAISMILGGLPLMGGSVLIDTSALRSRVWEIAVHLAGVCGNFALFLLFGYIVVLLPAPTEPGTYMSAYHLMAAFALLELWIVLVNLMPLPGIDGFNALAVQMPYEQREQFHQPWVRFASLIAFFALLRWDVLQLVMFRVMDRICDLLGMDFKIMIDSLGGILDGLI